MKLGLLLQICSCVLYLAIPGTHGQYRDGDIRLVGGSYQWEGRVEIYLSGSWGTIADSDWTEEDAQAVCRKIGHFKQGATAHSSVYFGEGSGAVHLDSVQCSGSEYNLTECATGNSEDGSDHSQDVGVKCQPAYGSYREGDIRLVGGAHNWEGRVEIFWSGSWGTISDSYWTDDDAKVVCRQLKHSLRQGRAIPCCSVYEAGRGNIHIHDVECLGSEPNIIECTYHEDTVNLSHQHDVGIQCQQGDKVKEGDIRLVEGSYLWQGRVEIFLSGVWGTMTDDYADYREASVVCRQLGYSTYNDYGRLGQGSGPIHLTYSSCTGSEFRLTDCDYRNDTDGYSHSEDWSVLCSIDGPDDRDARLSSNSFFGRVEVFLSGLWQPVANTTRKWNFPNAEVVCRELGYSPHGTRLYYFGYYSAGTNIRRMDNVVCIGSEARLAHCDFDIETVSSNIAIGMRCEQNSCYDGDTRLVGGESEAEGRVEICDDGKWYTVCGNQWSDRHTAVVCRHLGFSDIIGDSAYYSSGRFGKGTGPILMDFVTCTGSEPRLWPDDKVPACSYFSHHNGCFHNDDVGIQCQPASCIDGQIKLVGGIFETRGRVEICFNQRWETFSHDKWTAANSFVTCSELGFSITGLPYIMLGETEGVVTQSVPEVDDGVSSPIYVDFSFGSHIEPVVYVGTNGYFTFDRFTGYSPFSFNENTTQSLVAPYFTDIYISDGVGQINYEIHTPTTSPSILSQVNLLINDHVHTNFYGEWLLVATWDGVPHISDSSITSTFQGVLVTDYSRSFAVFTYKCGDLNYSHRATIGFSAPNGLFANHPSAINGPAQSIACLNEPASPWINVVYQISGPGKVGLPYITLGETEGVVTQSVPEVDDGVSSPIYVDFNFGSHIEPVVYVGANGYFTFDRFTGYSPFSFDETTTQSLVAPYFTDIDISDGVGQINYEIHTPTTSPSILSQANLLINIHAHTNFYGEWLLVATWDGVPHNSDSSITSTFQGVLVTDYSRSFAVFTYKCGDLNYSHRATIGFSAPNGLFANHPSAINGPAQSIACLNEPTSPWINVVYQISGPGGYLNDYYNNYYYYNFTERYINSGGPRHLKYYRCSHTEQRLSDCEMFTDPTIRRQYSDVGVNCYSANCDDGEVRLDEGETELKGRLEVCYSGRWGTVSDAGWSELNTQVVCNGFGYDVPDKSSNTRQSLSRPVYLHNVICKPSDLSLLECGFTRYSGNINDVQDVIIICQKSTCEDGDVKLVGGMSETEGRLEVCFNQRWTTVDGNGWTNSDTEVACRQLGYPTADISYTEDERTRRGQSLPAYLTLVGCYGSEERLIDCAYHDFGSTVSMDVSISCGSGEKEATSASQLSSVSAASLSIAVICAVAVAILAVVLIAMFILRRRKKNNYAPNNGHETTHHSTHDPDAGDSHSGFTKNNESISEKLQMEDVPMENYEEVEAPEQNPIPIPSKPKKAPKKPRAAGQNVSQVRYTHGGPAPTPATRPPQRGGQHQPRPPSPELIYECPD